MILITGGAGQLATCLKQLIPNALFVSKEELDITNQNAINEVLEKKNIQYIINCAAYTLVDKCEDEIELATLVNAKAPGMLAASCKEKKIKLIHISTDYVFDGSKNTPLSESDQTNPKSVYGQSKLDGENAIIENVTDYIIIRTSWLYSEYGHNFVKNITSLMKSRPKLGIVFDQIGSPTYACDLANAIVAIIHQKFEPGVYHYANLGVTSWYDLTKEIQSFYKINCEVNPIESYEYPTRAIRPKYSVLNSKKIQNTFNIKIPHWKESLHTCLQNLS